MDDKFPEITAVSSYSLLQCLVQKGLSVSGALLLCSATRNNIALYGGSSVAQLICACVFRISNKSTTIRSKNLGNLKLGEGLLPLLCESWHDTWSHEPNWISVVHYDSGTILKNITQVLVVTICTLLSVIACGVANPTERTTPQACML